MFDGAGAARCSSCAAPTTGAGGSAVPWERRAELGTGAAFFQTVKAVLVRPGEILAPPGQAPSLGPPFVFALICQSVGFLVAALWQVAGMVLTGASEGELGIAGAYALIGPMMAVYQMFIWGGIVHLLLAMFGSGRSGFTATARVQGYASAAALWYLVPILGPWIAAVWGMVAQILGLAAAHETSAGRTAAAVLLPLALCCLVGVALAVLAAVSFASLLPNQ